VNAWTHASQYGTRARRLTCAPHAPRRVRHASTRPRIRLACFGRRCGAHQEPGGPHERKIGEHRHRDAADGADLRHDALPLQREHDEDRVQQRQQREWAEARQEALRVPLLALETDQHAAQAGAGHHRHAEEERHRAEHLRHRDVQPAAAQVLAGYHLQVGDVSETTCTGTPADGSFRTPAPAPDARL
jgi:hypothetical protein